ncbi:MULTISPECIES: phosphatase PAP2 family protein [Acinetobacter]|uniref:phosphatase PAP2 family protein n=1 Tax=Acinetobacter TaxID=469 RepID=UPI001ABC1ABC|nr:MULTISPECIES: phosphatase PAP2 family protein [Acinetobacter]MBO3660231.1 phosphatase PAP2 family protein [Acinetobacter variabilis]MCU4363750.1 phosphatase PAP2 family protein [Acinetobacter variabilis]MCU4373805.1 phosphatase PAP2 family protein [Acinetobacter variabilis]UXI50500.1 phosphatase PAP2 family protein [Acinetobacter variabilis]
MSLDQLNLYLFHLLNVPDQASIWMINYASLIAHDLVYVFLLIFAIAWLRGSHEVKTGIIKAAIFTAITLSISEVLSTVLNTPRPFVMEVGRTLIEHAPTGSFPSNHMSIFSGIAFAYYFSAQRDLGRILLWTAWLVAWSRVYVGVHFPIDMVGAFLIALAVNLAGLPLWWKYENKIMSFIFSIHQFLFKPFIRMGWIK